MKFFYSGTLMAITLFGFFGNTQAADEPAPNNAHNFSFSSLAGEPIALSDYQGKVLLVVNTASQCGFTPQYAALQKIHEKYADKGLVLLAVPSNDFGGQEPGSAEEIQEFTSTEFHVTFPLTAKEVVSGSTAHPFFKWIEKEAGFMGKPRWNFYKYLIDKQGKLVHWYASSTTPDAEKLTQAIEAELAKP